MILIRYFTFFLLCTQLLHAGSRATVEAIGVTTFSWTDPARDRPIVVECWYPTDVPKAPQLDQGALWLHPKEARDAALRPSLGKAPLIVMSHGYGGERRDKSWLAALLVKKGFIVASVDHHGNTSTTLNPTATVRFWERPKDVSFVIDHIFQEPLLVDHLDPERIGFVGYSLGGMTGLALAGGSAIEVQEAVETQKRNFAAVAAEMEENIDLSPASENRFEPRIKAILLLAPATWCFNHPDSFRSIKTPIAIVGTVSDEVLSFDEHIKPLIQHSVPKTLKLLRNGASHFSFLNVATKLGQQHFPPRMAFDPEGVDRTRIHDEVGAFALDFFSEYLKEKPIPESHSV